MGEIGVIIGEGGEVPFLLECDTGFGRNGVQSPQAALDLANLAMRLRAWQSGYLYHYAFAMILGVLAMIITFITLK